MSEYSGYVYILSNPAMPGIVKIGRSKHGGRVRARDIYKQGGTGVPMPFKMEFELWSEDCVQLEIDVHDELEEKRINQEREFFQVNLSEAIEVVMRVFGADHHLTVDNELNVVRLCDIKNGYNGRQLYEKRTGIEVDFIDFSMAISDCLTEESICEALALNKKKYEERQRATTGRVVDFNG